jgi:NADP-dependent 3-hydroxy acid dehydrogenase YdfG
MMAKTLESAGAVVYIVGRRLDVIERAAKENSVRPSFVYLWLSDVYCIIFFT